MHQTRKVRLLDDQKVLILGDFHVPYHDPAAIRAVLDYARRVRPTELVVNGDLLDFEALSRFLKDPRKVADPQNEIDEGAKILRDLEKAAPRANRVFLLGNHEERLEKYLMKNAPTLLGLRSLNLSELLGLQGWTVVPYPQFYRTGSLIIQHGVSYGSTTADRNIAKFGGFSVIQGHSHRLSQRYVTSLHGTHSSVEGGCLCLLEQPYSKHNNWQAGFATYEDGQLRTHLIEKGKVI